MDWRKIFKAFIPKFTDKELEDFRSLIKGSEKGWVYEITERGGLRKYKKKKEQE